MDLAALDYPLRSELIAREPAEIRNGARGLTRMLVVDRHGRLACRHAMVAALPSFFSSGDVLVVNDSARIPGLIHSHHGETREEFQIRVVSFADDRSARITLFPEPASLPCELHCKSFSLRLESLSDPIKRIFNARFSKPVVESLQAEGKPITSFFYSDYFSISNYNPVYARHPGSTESPLAGLHLTQEILAAFTARGVEVVTVTLHSAGSWLPITAGETQGHTPQAERYAIPPATAAAVNQARRRGSRVIACGSTAIRALETACGPDGNVAAGAGVSTLFIHPGFQFRVVDAYFTNFHPARTGLLLLDAAFSSLAIVHAAYAEAQQHDYLFLEFGDAVLYL